ncbi:unnamed protein product [Prunus brigantina]
MYNLETKCSICNQPGHNKRKCPRVNEARSNSHVYSKHLISKVLYVWHSDMDSYVMFVGHVRSQRKKKIAPQGNTSTQRIIRQSRQKQASSSTQSRQKQPVSWVSFI